MSSPPIVPQTSVRSAWSKARATGIACAGFVFRMQRLFDDSIESTAPQHLAEQLLRVDRLVALGQRVDHVAVAADAHGAEPVEVARDRRLRDGDALFGEQLDELLLRGDLAAVEDHGDQSMTFIHRA